MEAFGMYLLKSVIWLTGFGLVYILFLRNERFFLLNRFFLLTGILTSLLFPFLTIRYQVTLPYIPVSYATEPVIGGALETGIRSSIETGIRSSIETGPVLLALYFCGIISVLSITLLQSRSIIKAIKKAEVIISGHPAKLIRTDRYTASFSFFSYVFVNPSVTDAETEEIINHELVHISQKHWIDLVLAELLCAVQWFNPLAWIYFRLIRQNHEFLADEVALQRTSDPAKYRATLLNQIIGAPVVDLANSFSYSLNKKRFTMMKNIITSPYRKMKILLILPVFAIVLWSFAEPEYKFSLANEGTMGNGNPALQEKKEVKGKVLDDEGSPLPGTSVVLKGTTVGTKSDSKGYFKLDGVPADGELILSFVGYKFKVVKPVFTSEMTVKMEQDTVKLKSIGVPPPPPPPPPPGSTGSKNTQAATLPAKPTGVNSTGIPPPPPPPPPPSLSSEQNGQYLEDYVKIKSKNGQKPLILVNGIEYDLEKNKLDPASIESITVLKDESATAVFGNKGKDGVIVVTLKDAAQDSEKKVVTVTGYGQQKTPPPPPSTGTKEITVTGYKLGDPPPPTPPSTGTVIGYRTVSAPPPPPAPKTDGNFSLDETKYYMNVRSESGIPPLVVIDGKIGDQDLSKLDPNSIESVSVLKGESATKLYGEKGKDGVVIIVTKGNDTKTESGNEPVTVTGYGIQTNAKGESPVIVEEMPSFPGGMDAMKAWIYGNIKIQKGMDYKSVTEPIYVNFTVGGNGKVRDVKIKKAVSPLFDAEAIRVVSSMPDWKPGSQNGKPVAVRMQLPIDFSMKVVKK